MEKSQKFASVVGSAPEPPGGIEISVIPIVLTKSSQRFMHFLKSD